MDELDELDELYELYELYELAEPLSVVGHVINHDRSRFRQTIQGNREICQRLLSSVDRRGQWCRNGATSLYL